MNKQQWQWSLGFFLCALCGVGVSQIPTIGQPSIPAYLAANGIQAQIVGTTASIGGSLLVAGSCSTGTVTLTGATTDMAAVASPQTSQPNGVQWQAWVSAANTVTVNACAVIAITPTASVYNVRVIP